MEVSMHEAQNVEVVKEAYAAFGRGDVPGIVALLDPQVVWKGVYGAAAHVPTAGLRRGSSEVQQFFKLVAEHVKFTSFEPREFVASGDKVVALGHYAATTPIGRSFDSDFAMVFTLRNGKVVEFQEFTDSAQVNAAYV
jgi:uncharacterized protein